MCPIKWQAAETIREKKYSHYSDVVCVCVGGVVCVCVGVGVYQVAGGRDYQGEEIFTLL